jgi:hypothetical protein
MIRFATSDSSKGPHNDELFAECLVLEYDFDAIFMTTIITLLELSAACDSLSIDQCVACDHNGERARRLWREKLGGKNFDPRSRYGRMKFKLQSNALPCIRRSYDAKVDSIRDNDSMLVLFALLKCCFESDVSLFGPMLLALDMLRP